MTTIPEIRERLLKTMGFVPWDGGHHVACLLERGEIYVVLTRDFYNELFPHQWCPEDGMGYFLKPKARNLVKLWIKSNLE
jgi:hypothetical protein